MGPWFESNADDFFFSVVILKNEEKEDDDARLEIHTFTTQGTNDVSAVDLHQVENNNKGKNWNWNLIYY